jgi:dihydrofolate reductase
MTEHSRVTIHMAASLDGFIARRDGAVDWMETADEYPDGHALDADDIAAFLRAIDCYVMGSRTYETAVAFEARGFGWAYGDTPVIVLTTRALAAARPSVEFYAGDLKALVDGRLRREYREIWCAGGGTVAADFLRLGLADEVRYSVLPVLIGDGIPFFQGLRRDVALHLVESKAYRTGIVALRYRVVLRSTTELHRAG